MSKPVLLTPPGTTKPNTITERDEQLVTMLTAEATLQAVVDTFEAKALKVSFKIAELNRQERSATDNAMKQQIHDDVVGQRAVLTFINEVMEENNKKVTDIKLQIRSITANQSNWKASLEWLAEGGIIGNLTRLESFVESLFVGTLKSVGETMSTPFVATLY